MVKQPRELASFGVSGLLGPKCEVYYSSIPSTRSLGRVSDLVVAKLKQAGGDELRIRALLLFSIFEAQQFRPGKIVNIECGVDFEDIAISVLFQAESDEELDSSLEKLVQDLVPHADHIFVRSQKSQSRFEVVSLLSLAEAETAGEKIVRIDLDSGVKSTPESALYVQLGDLDYQSLLKEERIKSALETPNGETLINSLSGLDGSKKVSGTEDSDDSLTVIKAGDAPQQEDHVRVPASSEVDKATSVEAYEAKIAELQAELDRFRARGDKTSSVEITPEGYRVHQVGGEVLDQTHQRVPGAAEKIKEAIGKIWPFKKKSELEEISPTAPGELVSPAQLAAMNPANLEGVASHLLNEIQNGQFNQALTRAQKEVTTLQKKDLPSPKAKRWVEGFMSELMTEKAKLVESAHKLNQSVRQKEHEFKTKESALKEELHRLTESMRLKNNLFSRTKDQLNETLVALEKFKTAEAGVLDDAKFKQKYGISQKLLAVTKKENTDLLEKIADLNKKMTQASMAKQRPGASPEMKALQEKYDRLLRQTEEFKKTNQNLLGKIGERKDRIVAEGNAEANKRLEAAMKLAVTNKREAEALRAQLAQITGEMEDLRKKAS